MVSTAALGAYSCVDKFGRPVALRVNLARMRRQWQFVPVPAPLGRWELRELEAEAIAVCRGQQ